MNVVSIASRTTDHATIRDKFAQAAYAGSLPRERWIEAQTLVANYDAATEDAARLAISKQMLNLAFLDVATVPLLRIVG